MLRSFAHVFDAVEHQDAKGMLQSSIGDLLHFVLDHVDVVLLIIGWRQFDMDRTPERTNVDFHFPRARNLQRRRRMGHRHLPH